MEILSIIIGYLLGAIPFALVIGKIFYKTDIRKYGSGNLGGTNAGRVLGKKAGVAVMVCDILKVVLAVSIASHFENKEMCSLLAGLFAALGHCYPVFAHFRGGKAVAANFGFLVGISLFVYHDPFIYLLPMIVFLVVLYLTKMVSLSSMIFSISNSLYLFFTISNKIVFVFAMIQTILIIYRHRSNIQRIINGNENKITWM